LVTPALKSRCRRHGVRPGRCVDMAVATASDTVKGIEHRSGASDWRTIDRLPPAGLHSLP